ncbi:MAG: CDP-alcohol phosphatidyltransferase [Novosphingobium sp.]|nr:CDP-alcohol phosphatidyltransferase [Novosphingobium sp.]MBX9643892.1 CDP-alcohol phosphatidyltransferase family protein [Novosphingobium sp.]
MTDENSHIPEPLDRIQQNVLAKAERRLLNWLCPRLPMWVTPDKLTGFGVFGAVVVFFGYALSGSSLHWLWLAILGYVFQWFGDSLDGSIARWRKIERPKYGYFIDHSVDGLVILLIMAGMGMSPYVRMDAALFATVGYLLLSIHAYLAARVLSEFKLSYLNFGPTELRFLLIGLTLAMMMLGPDAGRTDERTTGFDWFVAIAAIVLNALFIWQTLVTARRLDLMERPKD